jgi:hypothetical protein
VAEAELHDAAAALAAAAGLADSDRRLSGHEPNGRIAEAAAVRP